MKNPEEFCKELEALMVKYEIDQCTSIFPMEGMTRIMSYSIRKEEEKEMAKVYDNFAKTIGKIDMETITAVTNIMEGLIKEQEMQEEVIPQVTWEKIANERAEELLSEEDFEKLTSAKELKLAAVKANEWEYAARYREEELSFLNKVMDLIDNDKSK
jgi:hypothetical protein